MAQAGGFRRLTALLAMLPDDELCLCFHVSLRKLRNYLRIVRPTRASGLSECQGAGTGCGWCRPALERLFAEADAMEAQSAAEYRAGRQAYLDAGGKTGTGSLPQQPPTGGPGGMVE